MGQDDPPNYDAATLVAVPLDGLEPLKHLAAFHVPVPAVALRVQVQVLRLLLSGLHLPLLVQLSRERAGRGSRGAVRRRRRRAHRSAGGRGHRARAGAVRGGGPRGQLDHINFSSSYGKRSYVFRAR